MSIKNARTLGIRLDQKDTDRLHKFEAETTIDGVSLARAALKAALAYYEEHGNISLPLYLTTSCVKPLAPTVKAGPTKQGKPTNIHDLNRQIAADLPAGNTDLAPPVRVRYPSGKTQAKKEA